MTEKLIKSDNSYILNTFDYEFTGNLAAIASKSHAHRLLIAAALSDKPTTIICNSNSKDIEATTQSLIGLGADIKREDNVITVNPISKNVSDTYNTHQIDVGESGSTLRFLLPVVASLGINTDITMHGRLSMRPLSPLYEEMILHGTTMSPEGTNPFHVEGQLTGGEYNIAGNISSQFITGLLFALPLLKEDSVLNIIGKLESRPYVDITLSVIRQFGIIVDETDSSFIIPGNQKYISPDTDSILVDGDWSNAAFFLSAGAVSTKPVSLTGLNTASLQGDKKILDILGEFGATVEHIPSNSTNASSIQVSGGNLHGITIDASDIPDLVPILSVVAATAKGTTVIKNIERLRIKESDRVATVIEMISNLGGKIREQDNCIIIDGVDSLSGGTVDSYNDHRIAMSAAIASIKSSSAVTIDDPMSVTKSYPNFYEDFTSLLYK